MRNWMIIGWLSAFFALAGGVGAADEEAKDGAAADTAVVDSASRQAFEPPAFDKALQAEELFDDIALYSPKKVTYCGLGLVIRNTERTAVSVAVHDAKGRPVVTGEYGADQRVINVQTDAFPGGVYVYTVRMADTVYTRPFIVTR